MLTLYSKFLESQNSSLTEPVVAKITTNNKLPLPLKKDLFFLLTDESGLPDGFLGYLIPHGTNVPVAVNNIIQLTEDLSHLTSGDIVRFNPTKKSLRVLYRANSDNNSFLLTERCNSFCIMCSQPPRSVDDSYIADEIIQAIPLLPRNTREIGITGGEPTLQGEKFLEIIRQCRNYLPNTSLHVLTNGRNFEHEILAKKVSDIHHFDLMLGIPLYSDLANVHDFIVQAKGAYDQAIRGILNLKKYSQQVEIRIVILKQNYKRLPNLAEFIARNLTFVDQVVFMGLESTGFAKVNFEAIWIDPVSYKDELKDAVNLLSRYGARVKIYNHQLCVLDKDMRPFSVKSISDWKNEYMDVCTNCDLINECGGFFGTSRYTTSKHITPIKLSDI